MLDRRPDTLYPLCFLVRALLLVGLLLVASWAQAQDETLGSETGLARAETVFQRAETLLDTDGASIERLTELRGKLVEMRDAASAVVSRGSVEARVMQAQLDSLGPPPAESETETEEIATRRAELESALATANEPMRQAREALQRADLLIRETDAMIRRQGTQQLLKRFPSPLDPVHWVSAGEEMLVYVKRLQHEFEANLKSPAKVEHLRQVTNQALLLGLVGLVVLVIVQPGVVKRLENASTQSGTRARRWVYSILLNLMRLVLPAIGALMLTQTVPLLDLTPFSAHTVAAALPLMALMVVLAHWLGHTLFAPRAPASRLLSFEDKDARWGVRLCQWLGVVLAVEISLEVAAQGYTFNEASLAVFSTPVIFIASLIFWRLSTLLRRSGAVEEQGEGEEGATKPDSGFLTLISTLMRISALVAPVVVLLGYVNLARYLAIPLIMTMAELGIALFLFRLAMIVLGALVGKEFDAKENALSLLPIIVIFFLVLLFLPLLALTWGARLTDIAEVWHLLVNGVAFGDITLSLDVVIMLVTVFTLGLLLTRWLQRLLRVSVLPRTRLDSGAQNALVTGVGYVGLMLAALVAVTAAGLNLSSLAVVAGALSLGIGFGLQTIVSNFVSGIILLIERPIKEGDWIEVSGYTGYVRKISVRSTRIETFDGHDVIVPNSDLIAGVVTNMTLTSRIGRLIVPVGVAYGSDLEKVRTLLLEAAKSHPSIRAYPAPSVLFIGLGDSSLDFELRCFLKDVGEMMGVKSDLLFTIYVELNKAEIEIPFPQRDLHLRDIDRLVAAIESRGDAAAGAPVSDARREASLDT